jgi:gas vesicle protein
MARLLILGLLMGGLIGASAALLFAPGRGVETRRLVRSRAEPAVNKDRHVATRLARRDKQPPDEEDHPEELIWSAEAYRYQ